MDSINANLASMVNHATPNFPMISFQPTAVNNSKVYEQNMNDIAASVPEMLSSGSGFDMIMNNVAAFKDLISVAQGGLSQMREQGEGIRDLIAQAREEGVTPELLDKIQAEVDSRLADIKSIRDGANFNGVNPFDGKFSLDIPDILGLMGAQDKEEANTEITNMLASFDIDMSISGDGFSIGGSAKIEIGYTDDGALQINVDASMDYDLSGLLDKGVTSDEAFDMINNFLSMLGVQQGELGDAQNFLDALMEQIFNVMDKKTSGDGIELTEGSNSLVGKMTQQASITLDGMAGQAPNIAINIL